MSSNLETRSLLDEIRHFEQCGFLELGHPLLNRVAEAFLKSAGVGAIQAVAREGFSAAVQGGCKNTSAVTGAPKKRLQRFPDLKGENNKKSVEALITNTGKETMQWGFAAGMYSGLTYGLKEARGVHDWKNSALAGAVTGAALALTTEDHSHEQVVQCAITGAAISTVANLLTGVF
ncbi:PREDICTED: outer envelope pore protein 16-2, chloroplastic-like isoform X1 [Ipomoea nil]|uniref:outer envelope pore protein 16-2, chloroplastic-like isoform X1 n=1 Tax=Ipomoea nil TaxID=35883 RepID=UPI0009010241|nr:PREDICTED: outer envelope pore protein 16-2, chloroplastic-like isoform X1 [Ipomoea nil]